MSDNAMVGDKWMIMLQTEVSLKLLCTAKVGFLTAYVLHIHAACH